MYYPNRKSALFYAKHSNDIYPNLGYDYRGNIFKRTLSKIILSNKVNNAIMKKVDDMFSYLVDTVKQIRLHYMISLDKNDRNVN